MASTIESIGYDGTVDEVDWASLVGGFGATFVVLGLNSWKPGTTTAVARGITVQPGVGAGRGVLDTLSGDPVVLSADAVTSGPTRYDTLVATRNWATNTTTFQLRKGGTTLGIAPLTTNPGVEDDHPIAVYAITGGSAVLAADLRMWRGGGGGLVAAHQLALQVIPSPGSRVWVGDREFVLIPTSAGSAEWVTSLQVPDLARRGWISPIPRTNYDLWPANQNGNMAICSITAAPAGTYLLSGRAELSPQATLDSEQAMLTRYLANGALVANREFGSVMGAGRYRSETAPSVPHYHPGGNLTVILQARCAVVCAVRRAEVTATYIGPAQG